MAAHLSSKTPKTISGLWFSGRAQRSVTLPRAPALGSFAPIITDGTLELIIAPAHMGHGSKVTYNVQPVSRQVPSAAQA